MVFFLIQVFDSFNFAFWCFKASEGVSVIERIWSHAMFTADSETHVQTTISSEKSM